MAGIKETKESLVLGFAIAKILQGALKDGFQPADLLTVLEGLSSEENVEVISAAIAGIEQVPVEAADVDFFEGLELGRFVLSEVKKLVA